MGWHVRVAWGVGLVWWIAAAQPAEGYDYYQTAREAERRYQQELVKAKEERAAAEENLREALRLNGVLGRQIEQRYAQTAELQRQFHDLEQRQGTSTARIAELEQMLAAKQQAVDEASKHLAERDQLKAALSDRDNRLSQLQGDLDHAKQTLSAAAARQQAVSSAGRLRDEQSTTERKEMLRRIGELEQELKKTKEAAQPAGSLGPSKVKVYQVNDDYAFVVLSVKGIEWVQKGMAIALANGEQVVATAQVTELDGAGFAVAEITHQADPFTPIHKGDIFIVKPLQPGS